MVYSFVVNFICEGYYYLERRKFVSDTLKIYASFIRDHEDQAILNKYRTTVI